MGLESLIMTDEVFLIRILYEKNINCWASRLTDYLQDRGYYCVGADIGFFQYGVLYPPHKVPMIDEEARTISEEDVKNFDVILICYV